METGSENKSASKHTNRKILFVLAAMLVVTCLFVGGFSFLKINQPRSLLPATVEKQITEFTPYFFFGELPNGYSMNERSVSFDQGIVIVPLTKPNAPTLVLTEQLLPDTLSQDLLEEEDSIRVKDTIVPAIINKVEGRMVGIMTSKEHKLLLLVNAPDTLHSEDMIELLQALKPIK